ncbi:hypothetical protein F4782DRAFT_281644 [Xylaria castorea]|nr:hypothetical protein F4782DRAFT_281644 [Xylaria castorea]
MFSSLIFFVQCYLLGRPRVPILGTSSVCGTIATGKTPGSWVAFTRSMLEKCCTRKTEAYATSIDLAPLLFRLGLQGFPPTSNHHCGEVFRLWSYEPGFALGSGVVVVWIRAHGSKLSGDCFLANALELPGSFVIAEEEKKSCSSLPTP